MTTQLATRSRPVTRRRGVTHERGSASEFSDLFARVTSVRSATFDLVAALNAAGGRHHPDLEAASGQMQSIANQLGAIQALIQGLEA
jgi:hypothetical protein